MAVFMEDRPKGPVELLCKEIGFRFERGMERPEVLAAFVGQLVENIEWGRDISEKIGSLTGNPPSEASGRVLDATLEMLKETETVAMIRKAEAVHDLAHELNPECAYPTDHIIDMLSSCASAIRFGLETPCHSRHAASAARHVWQQRYGLRLEDEFTSAWCHDWSRTQMQRAILRLATPTHSEDTANG